MRLSQLSKYVHACLMAAFVCNTSLGETISQERGIGATKEMPCKSISGIYQYVGDIIQPIQMAGPTTFFSVIFGKPKLKGEPIAVELTHNIDKSSLRVRVSEKEVEPAIDFFIPVQCVDGYVVYQSYISGHADGSSYEVKAKFYFSKDRVGTLAVHERSTIRSTNLMLFWAERDVDLTARFLSAEGQSR